jgi:NADH dehydrogenase
MIKDKKKKRVVIVGGGFAGVRAALDLSNHVAEGIEVRLISDRDYFEYYPAMYRVVTGSSPLRVKIPLRDIFYKKNIEVINDRIIDINPKEKKVTGTSGYVYEADSLILAIGSEMNYFNIEGLEDISFSFKSIDKALDLRKRIHMLFEHYAHSEIEETLVSLHFVVVGGGASGVELAGELAVYLRNLANRYEIPESFITLDLVEASSRVLNRMPEKVSRKATQRLRELGVNVLANRTLIKGESWTVFLKDMNMGARTIIWTAGVKNNDLYKELADVFEFDGKGRVLVDRHLQAEGCPDVYIAGDNAATLYSGLAQTAIHNGSFLAENIIRENRGWKKTYYHPKENSFDIPIGPGWAILVTPAVSLFGKIPWLLRHIIDLKFYLSLLPVRMAFDAFFAKPYHEDNLDAGESKSFNH